MNNKFNFKIKFFTEISIIASIYVLLTVFLPLISYNAFQLRISEAMIVLVYFKRAAYSGLVLGCFIANLFSPLGVLDVIFGTLATVIGVGISCFIKKKYLFFFIPPIILNSVIIGLELFIIYKLPLFIGISSIFIEEFIVLFILGNILFFTLKKIGFKSDF